MASWAGDLGTNVLAEFVALVLLVVAGWILYSLTRRRRLLRFFGILSSRRIVVYLSHLQIVAGGALDIMGIPRSYEGTAVAFGEMAVGSQFRDLFNYFVPSLSENPGFLSQLLISDVQVQVLASPLNQQQVERATSFITLGSPFYSAASAFAETSGSQAKFDLAAPTIIVAGIAPVAHTDYGFVERIIDSNRRSVFYAAGLPELGTIGAANYLAEQWSQLSKKYGNDRNFLVMLEFDASDFHRWSVVFER